MRKTSLLVALVIGASLGAGCTTLKAWERSMLMSSVMEERSGDMGDRLDDHVHAVRESARGASSSGGAACGCS